MRQSLADTSSEPKHLVVNTEYIEVLGEEVAVHSTKHLTVDGDPCEGVFYLSRRAIYLEEGLKKFPKRYERVFKHEVMHAYLGISGLSESIGCIKIEEALCVLAEVME